MFEKESSEALFQLRQRVERIESDHPELRQKLESLLERMEHRYNLEGQETHLQILDEARDALQQFEVEHPRATGVLMELMHVLNSIGV